MEPTNPYAPPRNAAALPGFPGGYEGFGVWQQDGKAVLYANSGKLPNRCASCNAPAHHRISKTFYWHEPWLYALILGGWLVYAIVAMIVRKSATVEYWLCDEHRKKRTTGLVIAWVGFLASFVLMFVVISADVPALILACIAGMIVLPIVGGVRARMVSPARITDVEVHLKAGEPFVASLPPSPQIGSVGYGGQYGGTMNMGYGPPPPRW